MAGTLVAERTGRRAAPSQARRNRPPPALLAVAVATFGFIYAPIVVLVVFSFGERRIPTWPLQGFTLSWYGDLLASDEIRTALRNSIAVATTATAGALLLGTPIAYAAHRFRFPGKRLLRRLVLMPLVVPGVVTGIALLTLFDFFHVMLSLRTITVGHVTFLIAVFFTSVFARLEALGTQIERAAMDLGATEWRAFTRAVLPNLRLTLIGASLLAFALSFDEIAVTFFLTGTSNTVPVLIYSMMRLGITPTINALASSILVVSVVLVAIGSVVLGRETVARRPG